MHKNPFFQKSLKNESYYIYAIIQKEYMKQCRFFLNLFK